MTDLSELKDSKGNRLLNSRQIRSLEDAGITTIEMLNTLTKRELKEISGIGDETVEKIWSIIMNRKHFYKAKEIYEKRKQVKRLTTGSKKLDELLGGGIETQSITELAGEYGSGKSQMAHQLSVNVQLPEEQGGLNGKALFFDTEDTFRPERIVQMGKAVGLGEKALDGIVLAPCYTTDHQIFLLNHADKIIKEQNIKLIIVDSLMAHFRSEYIGREVLAERQQLLNRYLEKLKRLARAFNLVAFVTNQAVSTPDAFMQGSIPVGGNILGHASTTRLWIRQVGKTPKRIIRLLESPYLPEGEAVIQITKNGIEDIEKARLRSPHVKEVSEK